MSLVGLLGLLVMFLVIVFQFYLSILDLFGVGLQLFFNLFFFVDLS
jgi:hypothetical protein